MPPFLLKILRVLRSYKRNPLAQCPQGLPVKFERKLDLARGVSCRDFPLCRQWIIWIAAHRVAWWSHEVGVIGNIEEFRPEFQSGLLLNNELFEDRHVPVVSRRIE